MADAISSDDDIVAWRATGENSAPTRGSEGRDNISGNETKISYPVAKTTTKSMAATVMTSSPATVTI